MCSIFLRRASLESGGATMCTVYGEEQVCEDAAATLISRVLDGVCVLGVRFLRLTGVANGSY